METLIFTVWLAVTLGIALGYLTTIGYVEYRVATQHPEYRSTEKWRAACWSIIKDSGSLAVTYVAITGTLVGWFSLL